MDTPIEIDANGMLIVRLDLKQICAFESRNLNGKRDRVREALRLDFTDHGSVTIVDLSEREHYALVSAVRSFAPGFSARHGG